MIVGARFEGDDLALAWRQHDCYGDALHVIRSESERRYRSACHLLGLPVPTDVWPGKADLLDHRAIQPLHDLLAAIWRHSVRPPDPAFAVISPALDASMAAWLSWLRAEMKDWFDGDHEVVRLWLDIQQGRRQQADDAEDSLRERLVERHAHLSWLQPSRLAG